MTIYDDWYPNEAANERLMYENIDVKIDGLAAKYPFLTPEVLAEVHTMCKTFIEVYDKVEFNRAAAKAMTTWFRNLVESAQTNEAVDEPPVFQKFVIPAGAKVGIEQQCRAFRRLLVSQPNYDKADGLNLMLEKGESAARDIDNAVPEYKLSITPDLKVINEWKKEGFDMLEWQYRKAGEQLWQLADKSTEKVIEFTPPLASPGAPEKFEFRAIYILKGKRVGQWSQTYTLTIG